MKYFSWLWNNSRGIRWNTVVRIIAGIIQVVLSLLMVWLSKRFIDKTILLSLEFRCTRNIVEDFPYYIRA
jgi:ABC-type multidrug transport system fused ATPase/permease subunit